MSKAFLTTSNPQPVVKASLSFLSPQPNNGSPTSSQIPIPLLVPTELTQRQLHLIFIIHIDFQTLGPLPITLLNNLVHNILLLICIIAADTLHELLDIHLDGDVELGVRGGIDAVDGLVVLPGLGGVLEDVDDGVFDGEDVVVAWWDTDAAEVVLELDAREPVVRERGDRRMCGVVGIAGHHRLHVWHGWLVNGCWRLDVAWHAGILGYAEAAGVGWWWPGVIAMKCVVASVWHGVSHGV